MNDTDRRMIEKLDAKITAFHSKHDERSDNIKDDIKEIKDKLDCLECSTNKNDIAWLKKIIWLPVSCGVLGFIGMIYWFIKK